MRLIALISAASYEVPRINGQANEIKFIQKILDYFNYNISLANRDQKSCTRLKLLLSVIPSFSEITEAFSQYKLDESVTKLSES